MPNDRDFHLALALSGGNALGAYQAGAYQALQERGFLPDWVVGGSAGAINGAIICGNAEEERLSRLEALWRPHLASPDEPPGPMETARRSAAALWTVATGHPDIFAPRNLFGPFWNPFANPEPASLYDSTPLTGTLERLVDFDRLNRASPRFCATAVDVETGDDIVFDTRRGPVGVDHLRASAALLPAFSPVRVGDRLLADAGISANLPLDTILSELPDQPLLCIAIDLLPLRAPAPGDLGETTIRMQDLMFATQSRRAIAAWQGIFDERLKNGTAGSVTILHIAYSDPDREVSGKAFDFSPASAAARWRAGQADLTRALDALEAGEVATGAPGLTVHAMDSRRPIEQVFWRPRAVNVN